MDYHTGNTELDTQLDERFAILSPVVRQLLSGEAIPTLASELAQRHSLDETARAGIETEISMVLMYLEPVEDFVTNLMTEYLIPPRQALDIEKEVTEKLFTPIMSELGHSSELTEESKYVPDDIAAEPGIATTATVEQAPVVPPSPIPTTPTPAPEHIPVARVMPQSPAAVTHDPKASTELPNALLQNLKASLMHGAPEEPLEGTNPAPSYNAILNTKPPTTPNA